MVQESPIQVAIWFDTEVEPGLSILRVVNTQGQLVSNGNGEVDMNNRRLLRTRLPILPAGSYRVSWRALSRDGHITQGSYRFTVGPR